MSNITLFNSSNVPAFARNNELSETAKALAGGSGSNTKRISIKGGVFRLIAGGKEIASVDDRHLVPGTECGNVVEVDHAVLDPGRIDVGVVPHRIEVREPLPASRVTGGDGLLHGLQCLVDEKRPFRPHLTIGRIRHLEHPVVMTEALDRSEVGELGEFTVGSISLIKSQLDPAGSIYTTLSEAPLGDR